MSVVQSIIKSRQRRQALYQKRISKRISHLAIVFLILFSLIVTAGLISVSILYASLSKDLPSLETLPIILEPEKNQLPKTSRLLDRSGEQVIAILENSGARGRDYLTIQNKPTSSFSEPLISATIASMEPDYWTKIGFTLDGSQDQLQPTIAQSIIRSNFLIEQSPSLQRSLLERILSTQFVSQFGREKVLEWYLNSADYGNLAFGADAAARVYFGKPATNLSVAEAALLAAAAESPKLNPIDAPVAADEGKERILNLMFEQGLITADQLQTALEEKVKIQPSKGLTYDAAPHFTQLVIDQASIFVRPEQLFRGGYDIITTMDYNLQNQVECTITAQSVRIMAGNQEVDLEECEMARLLPAAKIDGKESNANIKTSVIVTDPNSGQVLSMAGEDGAGHPPGTILTPIIYLTSFTRGASPASMLWDIPATLVAGLPNYQNPDEDYHGPINMRTALVNDYLIPAIQILSQMSPDQVWQTARQLGIANLQIQEGDGNLIIPLQGGKADLIEISQAYGVFASQGILAGLSHSADIPQEPSPPISPQVILRIQDHNGNG